MLEPALMGSGTIGTRTNWRAKIFAYTDAQAEGGKLYDGFMVLLILANVVALILETVEPLYIQHRNIFDAFEIFSVAVWSADYIVRLWACTATIQYSGIKGLIRYVSKPMNIVDVLAILPFYLPMVGVDLRAARTLRILRVLRIAKLAKYTNAFGTLGKVCKDKKEELITSMGLLFCLLLGASTLMYFAERAAQPDKFGSIPEAMWWGVATVTTVGYGDVFPVTVMGRVFATLIAFLGVALLALPTGIIGAGFMEELQNKKAPKCCANCGQVVT